MRSDDWVRRLLSMPKHGCPTLRGFANLDLSFEAGYWGQNEHPLPPSKRLLQWLVRNPAQLRHSTSKNVTRNALLSADPSALEQALAAIESSPSGRGWHLLEGTTFPDATLFTPDAIVVVEGKRTEAGPTVDTSWLLGRHQMWRHIEGAWSIRGTRRVLGLFLVEAVNGELPEVWVTASEATYSPGALRSSFPHLDAMEREELAACFAGVATWQQVCAHFELDPRSLPDTVDDVPADA
jgi:hypothetical protein